LKIKIAISPQEDRVIGPSGELKMALSFRLLAVSQLRFSYMPEEKRHGRTPNADGRMPRGHAITQ